MDFFFLNHSGAVKQVITATLTFYHFAKLYAIFVSCFLVYPSQCAQNIYLGSLAENSCQETVRKQYSLLPAALF